ncbi:pentatricopeptide repeat-containing protein At1g63400 [Lactuca sativa]|uniref:pentatricopeptide repeat-containing protein At1g63400 n=1 Tax=Lactuca sativa TaxID=4236 RepID=UPI001C68B604|nr:pentatricopeptide repeat-containing protein At1g63400 [Lactuca sativa]
MVGLDLTPDMVSYTTVIDSLFKMGSEDDALDLFREMAFHIGILPNSVTYSSLLHCLRILSHENDISKLLKDMEDKGVYVDLRTFNIFVDAYCKEGRMEDAESLVKLMIQRRMGPNVVTYRWLIDGYCFLGKMSEAWGIFVLMRRRGVIPNVDIYNSLLDGYFKDSETEDAMDLFHEMMKLGGITYDNMGLFRVGCCTEEQELFNEVQTPNEYTFKIVLEGLCNNNQVEEAVSLFHSMGDEKFSLNIGLYNILINGARTNGKLDIARSLYNELTKKGGTELVKYKRSLKGTGELVSPFLLQPPPPCVTLSAATFFLFFRPVKSVACCLTDEYHHIVAIEDVRKPEEPPRPTKEAVNAAVEHERPETLG